MVSRYIVSNFNNVDDSYHNIIDSACKKMSDYNSIPYHTTPYVEAACKCIKDVLNVCSFKAQLN